MKPDKTSEREINKIAVYRRGEEEVHEGKVSYKMKIILLLILVFLVLSLVIAAVMFIYLKYVKKDKENSSLKPGYFLPTDDKNNYYKCSLSNCKECKGEINDNVCISCLDNTIPVYGDNNSIISCNKAKSGQGKCQIGSEEKCLTCDYSKGECASCNSGYYMPEDESTNIKCQKCSIKNCEKCSGNKSSDICISCEDYTLPIYENEKIKNCIVQIGDGAKCLTSDTNKNECLSCNLGYRYEKGKCLLDHHFKASFITNSKNEKIKLAYQIFPFILEMIVDGIKLTSPVKEYAFSEKGEHTIYYKLKKSNSLSMIGMFEGLTKMTSISFTKLFNIKNNQKMDRMFYNCQKLTSVDFSNVNTDGVVSMNYIFYQCLSLTSADLSLINATSVEDISYMFADCTSLKSVSFNNFKTNKLEDISYLFKGCCSLTSIDLSSLNTVQVKDVTKMFSGCTSLTSIDISKFYLPNVESLDYMFIDCSNLQYINMALLNNRLRGTFDGVPSSGTIVTNNELKADISKSLQEWTINIE